ncbi:MAG: hypothetical protein NTW59_00940 [Candidatus Diapherotrites archaeon]|nr:hypothetical protein [Candidatus Diapherotrites archaeon]
MRKFLLIAGLLLLLCATASAQFYLIDRHAIEITVDRQGNAVVSDKFFIQFQNQQQLDDFRAKVTQIGVNIDAWLAYDDRIKPAIGAESDITVSKVSFVEEPSAYLEIRYSLNDTLMEKKSETSRVIGYGIKEKFFSGFLEGSLWVIPAGTTITVILPGGVEVLQPVEPDAATSGNTIMWSGYKYSNKLTLNYNEFKQIASFDLDKALQQVMESDLFWVIVAVLAVSALLGLWKRRAISEKIERYIVEHSDLRSEEE